MTSRAATPLELRLEALGRTFGGIRALTRVSARICGGETVAVMGPNGAGKSTLLSILATRQRPTSGRFFFNGTSVSHSASDYRATTGFLSHAPGLYPDLSVYENLRFYCDLLGITDDERLTSIRQQMALDHFWNAPAVRRLSHGQAQRVALARAMLHSPSLLFLDEPATGLDISCLNSLCDTVAQHRRTGGICLAVTHEPALAVRIATRLWLLHRGRLLVDIPCPKSDAEIRQLFEQTCQGPFE
jgi:heme ABC exporter ATP-binding subunit CcmA